MLKYPLVFLILGFTEAVARRCAKKCLEIRDKIPRKISAMEFLFRAVTLLRRDPDTITVSSWEFCKILQNIFQNTFLQSKNIYSAFSSFFLGFVCFHNLWLLKAERLAFGLISICFIFQTKRNQTRNSHRRYSI